MRIAEGGAIPDAVVLDAEVPDFGYLFQAHHRDLFRLALLLTGGDRSLAEEAVSQAFVTTLPKWRKGEVLDPVRYLRRAVANHVNGSFRRRRLERRESARPDDREPARNGGEGAVDDRDVLWAALRLLPPKQRSAVVLRYYLDLSELEVARVLQVSVGTVKSQTARGLVKLRSALGGLDA